MPKINPISRKKLISRLKALGFECAPNIVNSQSVICFKIFSLESLNPYQSTNFQIPKSRDNIICVYLPACASLGRRVFENLFAP